MSLLQALLLGIIQGITEFFPISSSTHLKLAKMALGILPDTSSLIFDLSCHLGTTCALLLFFHKTLLEMLLKKQRSIIPFFLASLPLIPCYFLLAPARKAVSDPRFLGLFLLVTALILFLAHYMGKTTAKRKTLDYFLIGTAQGLALFPGISRSGATIATARLCGFTFKDAVSFSFILSIPAVLGGILIEGAHLALLPATFSMNELVGFFSAFLTGLATIKIAMKILSNGRLNLFAWYCLVLGLIVTICFFKAQ